MKKVYLSGLSILFSLINVSIAIGQSQEVGTFKFSQDIGKPKIEGSAIYDPSEQV